MRLRGVSALMAVVQWIPLIVSCVSSCLSWSRAHCTRAQELPRHRRPRLRHAPCPGVRHLWRLDVGLLPRRPALVPPRGRAILLGVDFSRAFARPAVSFMKVDAMPAQALVVICWVRASGPGRTSLLTLVQGPEWSFASSSLIVSDALPPEQQGVAGACPWSYLHCERSDAWACTGSFINTCARSS
jgi:hypothetical protein